tara:strand:+ start:1589 stop:2179 length:591 start_codon:yes stop_codon:yes gene_type:complete
MSFLRNRYKCCVVGDHGVGKTSIIHALLGKSLDNLQSTVGIDFFSSTMLANGKDMYITIWDTAGAERFHSLMHSYIRGSDIIMLVYDNTNKNAMQRLTYWLRQIEHNKPLAVVIVGNKNDLSEVAKHDVNETIEPYVRQNWLILTGKCSSRRRKSVQKIFQKTLTMITKEDNNSNEVNKVVRFTSRKNIQTQTCCT